MTNALYRNDRPGAFPDSWYAATADIPDQRPVLRGQNAADVCIVGAGFTGLMAALELSEAGMKVIVLDAHRAGWGASGRNGGQVGSGFNQDQRWISARLGKGPAKALWDMTEEAKALLKTRIEQVAPDARFRAGVTEPLGDRAQDILAEDIAVADDKFVVNYFRLSEDNRLLFGGRENYSIGFPQNIEPALRKRMEYMFPQLRGVKIDYTWGGSLGITRTRLPMVERVADNILSAGGYSGHGVAHSGFAGRLMAEAVRGQAERFDIFASLPTPAFPGGTMLRAPMLAAAMTWYSLRDKLGL